MGGTVKKVANTVKPLAEIAAAPITAPISVAKAIKEGKSAGAILASTVKPIINPIKDLGEGAIGEIMGTPNVPNAADTAPTELTADEKAKLEADSKRKARQSLLTDTPGRKQTVLTNTDAAFPYRLY